jgi:hypothetical protein
MDPLSVTASIIAVVTFAEQVGSAIRVFIKSYQAAGSELDTIAVEISNLSNVLQCLEDVYAGHTRTTRLNQPAGVTRLVTPLKCSPTSTDTALTGGTGRPYEEYEGAAKNSRQVKWEVEERGTSKGLCPSIVVTN